MSYTHLTKNELIFIESYHAIGMKSRQIAQKLRRGHEAIYRVLRQLKVGKTAIEIYSQYKKNKLNCGRKAIQLPQDEIDYINDRVDEGWIPDVIIGRKEKPTATKRKEVNNPLDVPLNNVNKIIQTLQMNLLT